MIACVIEKLKLEIDFFFVLLELQVVIIVCQFTPPVSCGSR